MSKKSPVSPNGGPKPKKMTYEELENYAKRLQADFENYKKRNLTESTDFKRYANTDLILQILPVLDNFRIAVKHLPKELENNSWVVGVRHIESQLEQILAQEGVEKIESLGQNFDPAVHEAVEEVTSPRPPGEIVDEIQNGYTLNGKIIRHAKVKVSREKKS